MCHVKESKLPTVEDVHQIREELKVILGQYRVLTASIRIRLEAMGFTFTKRKTHYKVYYMNIPSRFCSMSVTASDKRTGILTALKFYRYLVVPYMREQYHMSL